MTRAPDPPSLESLLEHRTWVRSMARALAGPDEADDVEQLTWLSAVEHPPRATWNLRGWLAAVLRNWVRRSRRGERRALHRARSAPAPAEGPDPSELASRREEHDRLAAAVLALAPPLREAVVLRHVEGLPVREVARRAGVPLETARSRLRLALARLRAVLRPPGERHLALGALVTAGSSKALVVAVALAVPLVAVTAWHLGSRSAGPGDGDAPRLADEMQRLHEERDALVRERAQARAREETLATRVAALEREAREARRPPGPGAPGTEGSGAAADAREREARVRRWSAEGERALAAKDGEAALAALRELLGLSPEGRVAAMDLTVRVSRLVEDRAIAIRESRWSGFLSGSGVVDLMTWSLENESPEEFREFTAWELPWRLPAAETVQRFSAALARETAFDVRKALVRQLADLGTPAGRAVLVEVLKDPARDGVLRALAATDLAATGDAAVLALLRELASEDAAADVRDAARAAALAADPPATGFLVTMVDPDGPGGRAGLRPGDVVTAFDGTPVAGADAESFLWRGVGAARDAGRNVRLDVFRDGKALRLAMAPDFPAIVGRPVVRRE